VVEEVQGTVSAAALEKQEEEMEDDDTLEEEDVCVGYERYFQQMRVPPPKFSLGQVYTHLFGKKTGESSLTTVYRYQNSSEAVGHYVTCLAFQSS
jgi:hypothetical protein